MIKLKTKKSRVGAITTTKEKTPKKKEVSSEEYITVVKGVEITTGEKEHYVVSVSKKGEDGEPHLDIRKFINTEKYQGATKTGINMHIENLEELIETLELVRKRLVKQGEL